MTRSGEIISRGREDLVFAYRHSSLDELVILSANLPWKKKTLRN